MDLVYSVLLVAFGVMLIGVELKLIPGFGLIGILGFVTAIYGGWTAVAGHGGAGVLAAMGSSVVAVVLIILAVRSAWARRLVLQRTTVGQPSELPSRQHELVGRVGTAVTDLRPAGIGRFDGKRLDVVSENAAWLQAGTALVVVRINQNSVVVREAPAAAAPSPEPVPTNSDSAPDLTSDAANTTVSNDPGVP